MFRVVVAHLNYGTSEALHVDDNDEYLMARWDTAGRPWKGSARVRAQGQRRSGKRGPRVAGVQIAVADEGRPEGWNERSTLNSCGWGAWHACAGVRWGESGDGVGQQVSRGRVCARAQAKRHGGAGSGVGRRQNMEFTYRTMPSSRTTAVFEPVPSSLGIC
jgi:hypothetical protein